MSKVISWLADLIRLIGKDGSTGASVSNPVPVEVENTVAVTSAQLPGALDADGGVKVHVQNQAASTIQGTLDDSATTAAVEDAAASVRITAQRALHANLRNNAGTEVGTSGAPLRTDPTGTTTQPVSASSLPLPSGAATETTLDDLRDVVRSGRDIFDRQKVSQDSNQVEVPYDDTNWTNFIDSTSSGGATGPTQANGQVTITSGSGTNATYHVLSKDTVKYRLGQEVGWGGTFKFDAAGVANADVWWGPTDDTSFTNTVRFMWKGTSWGIQYRRGGSEIWFKTPAQWLDPCDSTAGSQYTTGGSPVAMDKTKDQIVRIRAGLFGHRGFVVEIAAPEVTPNGATKWVKIIDHTNINDATVPVFTNNDLKLGMGVVKTGAGSTSLTITSACQAGWTASDKARINDTLSDRSLASRVVAALVGRTNSGTWVGVAVNNNGRLFVTNDSVGTTGSAVPTEGTLVAGTDGTNLRALKTDAGGELQVDVLSSALPTGASTLAEQQTQTTHQSNAAASLGVLDDWDESDRAKVNIIEGQAGVAAGAGAVSANTQRVTLATEDLAALELVGIKGADGSAIVSTTNRLPVEHKAVVSSGNSTTTPLGVDGVFTGTWEDLLGYASIKVLGLSSHTSAASGAVVQFSNDGVTAHKSVTATVLANIPANFDFTPDGRYFRIVYTNGGTAQTSFSVQTIYSTIPSGPIYRPVADVINDLSLAQMTRSVETGRQPSGTYVNTRESGILSTQSSTTTIAATTSFTGSDWIDTTGYIGAAIFIKSDANSAANGVILQFSYDGGSTVDLEQARTYDSAPDGDTQKFAIATPGVHIRVKVTAGGSDMTNLVLKSYLLAEATEDVSIPVGDVPVSGMIADVNKSQLFGETSAGSGVYKNVLTSTSGNLHVNLAESSGEVKIKALTGGNVFQKTVGTSATLLDDPQLANRKSIRVKALSSNTEAVYIGYTSGVTTSNGDELAAGEAIDLEIDTTLVIYGICASGGQIVSINQVS